MTPATTAGPRHRPDGEVDKDRPIRFGTLGTVKPIKGTDLLVDAFMQFDRAAPVELVIAGLIDRPWAEALRERAQSDPRIRFIGRSSQARSFLSSLDVFVLPSRSEGMSNALLEAMAAGLPCIATDVGSNRSLLCPPGEPAAGEICAPAADALFRALSGMASSEEARLGYGARARALVARRYTIPTMVLDYERLYRSVAGRPAGARRDRTGAMRHRMTIMVESDSPVRVVVVVSHLGLGGAERQTLDLLRQLRGTAWAPVRVVCLSGQISPYGEAVRALGYPLSIIARAGGFDVGRWLALRRLFRRERASVIHAVNWFASGYSVLAQSGQAQIVSSIRNSHLPAGRVRQSALPPLIRRAASVLVNSERGVNW